MHQFIEIKIKLHEDTGITTIIIQGKINHCDYSSNYVIPPISKLKYYITEGTILICLKSILIEEFQKEIQNYSPELCQTKLNNAIDNSKKTWIEIIDKIENSQMEPDHLSRILLEAKIKLNGIDLSNEHFKYWDCQIFEQCKEFNEWLIRKI